MTKDVKIKVKVEDKASDKFSKIGKASKKMGASIKKNMRSIQIGAGVATAGIIKMGKNFVEAANNQIEQEKKLAVVLKQRTNATDEQIDSIKRLASEQQKIGVIGDEMQLAGAQQLATFMKNTKSVESLIPAMNNLVAQQKGVNASQEDMINIANMMGKVMDGQVGALSRVGISFSDAQAEIMKTGTEMERSATLAEIITSNVGEMNEALAKTTFAGQMTQLNNNLGDVGETIGMALIPIITSLMEKITPIIDKVSEWINKNPELTAKIMVVVGAITALIAATAILGPAIAMLMGPIGLILAGVAALGLARATNFGGIQEITASIIGYITETIGSFINIITQRRGEFLLELGITNSQFREGFRRVVEIVMPIVKTIIGSTLTFISELFKGIFGGIFEYVKSIFGGIKDVIVGVVKIVKGAVTGNFQLMFDGLKQIFGGIFKILTAPFQLAKGVIIGIVNGIIGAINKITGAMNKFLGTSIGQIKKIGQAANSVTGSIQGGATAGVVQTGGVPGRASGGPVDKNTMYEVGEEGPEMFVPGANGSIVAADKMKSILEQTAAGNTGVASELSRYSAGAKRAKLEQAGITGSDAVITAFIARMEESLKPKEKAMAIDEMGAKEEVLATPTVIENNPGDVSINIDMGGITINNQTDEDNVVERIVGKIQEALKRQTQLFNMGVN